MKPYRIQSLFSKTLHLGGERDGDTVTFLQEDCNKPGPGQAGRGQSRRQGQSGSTGSGAVMGVSRPGCPVQQPPAAGDLGPSATAFCLFRSCHPSGQRRPGELCWRRLLVKWRKRPGRTSRWQQQRGGRSTEWVESGSRDGFVGALNVMHVPELGVAGVQSRQVWVQTPVTGSQGMRAWRNPHSQLRHVPLCRRL